MIGSRARRPRRSAAWCWPTWDRTLRGGSARPLGRAASTLGRPVEPEAGVRSRLNLGTRPGSDVLLRLTDGADVLVESVPARCGRAGTRLDTCALRRNPRLIYARMTGWGQDVAAHGHRKPRHRLHRRLRQPRPIGRALGRPSAATTWSGISAAAGCCSPSACWPPCWSGSGPGQAGRGRRHGGRLGALASFLYGRCGGAWQDRAGHERARTAGPRSTTPTPPPTSRHPGGGQRWSEVLRRAAGPARPRRGEPAAQYDRSGWPELRARLTGGLRRAHAGGMGGGVRGLGRVRGPVVSPGMRPVTRTTPPARPSIDVGRA